MSWTKRGSAPPAANPSNPWPMSAGRQALPATHGIVLPAPAPAAAPVGSIPRAGPATAAAAGASPIPASPSPGPSPGHHHQQVLKRDYPKPWQDASAGAPHGNHATAAAVTPSASPAAKPVAASPGGPAAASGASRKRPAAAAAAQPSRTPPSTAAAPLQRTAHEARAVAGSEEDGAGRAAAVAAGRGADASSGLARAGSVGLGGLDPAEVDAFLAQAEAAAHSVLSTPPAVFAQALSRGGPGSPATAAVAAAARRLFDAATMAQGRDGPEPSTETCASPGAGGDGVDSAEAETGASPQKRRKRGGGPDSEAAGTGGRRPRRGGVGWLVRRALGAVVQHIVGPALTLYLALYLARSVLSASGLGAAALSTGAGGGPGAVLAAGLDRLLSGGGGGGGRKAAAHGGSVS